jgi:hypothetical protein
MILTRRWEGIGGRRLCRGESACNLPLPHMHHNSGVAAFVEDGNVYCVGCWSDLGQLKANAVVRTHCVTLYALSCRAFCAFARQPTLIMTDQACVIHM